MAADNNNNDKKKKKTENNQCWRGFPEVGILVYYL